MELSKKTLDELIAVMQRDGLERLRVEYQDLDLDLRMSPGRPSPLAQPPGPSRAGNEPPAEPAAPEAAANVRKVLAPLIGVFYRTPAPGAAAFVNMGDTVVSGQVLCILEAMKLMNEIVSEHSGKIVRICANPGDLVTLQQELFWIET
jgi:acetyl-CoA carboxylase biotin carboxyl carrier protein